ncbi:uncharacterized protein N7477_009077 [Penicillium maclennaniae]|uniref:uncharacterized protein n=1 Tax=Penicillium maclennaniae TaxID=1343394 RepID=UPI0025415157|nr:uncharacterized protein N7477_009077 [Penicillium maclennaniae]KAJ5661461.1 hypothetical protein N7477_009077 [Penicillium maclennaniae]
MQSPRRWQWAGLAGFLIIAFIALIQYGLPVARQPIPVSLDFNATAAVENSTITLDSAKASPGTSRFHLLIPATGSNHQLCRTVASATILGYPVPVFNGWKKEGDLDASKTHLAKVRNVMLYLESLPASSDDDLVLMIDGLDVTFQLPPDVLIERYFAINKAASAQIAARFGNEYIESLSPADAPRQTILFGPEKVCYPTDWARVGCWANTQNIGIPNGAFGPDDGQLSHNLPRWLNSGTIMGPVGDMRRLFAATLDRIKEFYDPNQDFSDSDQKYMSDLFFHGDVDPKHVVPPGGPNKVVPPYARDQSKELHVGVDYRSGLFQTNAGSEHVVEFLTYNETGASNTTSAARVTRNISEAPNFTPFKIQLPANVARSITALFKSIAHAVDPIPSVSELRLGTNIVTSNIYGMYHWTGDKDDMDTLWQKMWFYPYVRPLFNAAVAAMKAGQPIGVADDRTWVSAHKLAPNSTGIEGTQAAGAWADIDGGWLGWEELCGNYEVEVFGAPESSKVFGAPETTEG